MSSSRQPKAPPNPDNPERILAGMLCLAGTGTEAAALWRQIAGAGITPSHFTSGTPAHFVSLAVENLAARFKPDEPVFDSILEDVEKRQGRGMDPETGEDMRTAFNRLVDAACGVYAPSPVIERVKRGWAQRRLAERLVNLSTLDPADGEAWRHFMGEVEAVCKFATAPATPPTTITLLTDEDLCARHTPLPAPIVAGYLNRGEVSLLAASSKAGKSWMALQLAKCIGAGVPFLECPTTPGTCIFLNTEISGAAWEERSRLQNEALGIESPRILHASTRGQGITIENVVPLLKEAIAAAGNVPIDLIVVDPYYVLTAGLGENEAGDVAASMLGFQRMAEELNAAVLITHHFTKGDATGKAQLDRASGSGVFARSVDNFFTLTEDAQGRMVLEATRRNGASPPPLEVAFEFPVWHKVGEAEAVLPKRGRGSAYSPEAFVGAFPDGSAILTWGQLRERLGVSNGTFANYLNRAMKEGVVEKAVGGYRLAGEYAAERRRQVAEEEADDAV